LASPAAPPGLLGLRSPWLTLLACDADPGLLAAEDRSLGEEDVRC